jgi:hypothetical protein
MPWSFCRPLRRALAPLTVVSFTLPAFAQSPPQAPPNAAFPSEPAPGTPPAQPPGAAPAPAPAPPPGYAPSQTQQQPYPYQQQPYQQQPYQQQPYQQQPYQQQPYQQQPYQQQPYQQQPYQQQPTYGEPPPPPAPADEGEDFEVPPFSVRVDPLNWLLFGRLGFELEVGLLKWLTLETVPMFVVNDSPPALNLEGREDNLFQESNGLGALSGATLGLNFWLNGKAFKGYALGLGFTNYGLRYETRTSAGRVIDTVTKTERQFYGMLNSVSRWGAFTLGGGLGLAYQLSKKERCFPASAVTPEDATDQNCGGELQVALDRSVTKIINMNGFLYPMALMARLSLGVTID